MRASSLMRRKCGSRDQLQARMAFINLGMLDSGNLYLFEHRISELPSDSPIVDIGSFAGFS
jgi:hypothetical protein